MLVRGLLNHATEDLCGSLVRQVSLWLTTGTLCDRDNRVVWIDALQGVELPLLVVASPGDPLCTPEAAAPVLAFLDGDHAVYEPARPCSHLELVQGDRVEQDIGAKVVEWLDARRSAAW